MINQQLLDYIKQQLQQGISREIISSNLTQQGWQQQDISKAFSQMSGQNTTIEIIKYPFSPATAENVNQIDNFLFLIYSILVQLITFVFTGITLLATLAGLVVFPILKGLKLIESSRPAALSRAFFFSVIVASILLVIFKVSMPVAIVYAIVAGTILSLLFYLILKKKYGSDITPSGTEYISPNSLWPQSMRSKAFLILYVLSLVGGMFHAYGLKLPGAPVPLVGIALIFFIKEWGKKEKVFALGLSLIVTTLGVLTLIRLSGILE